MTRAPLTYSASRTTFLSRIKSWIKNQRLAVVAISYWKQIRHRGRDHSSVYDGGYFDMVDRTSGASAEVMARTLIEQLHPKRVIDVGCGTGQLLLRLREKGVEVLGLEYASSAIDTARSRSLPIELFDATDQGQANRHFGDFDLAVCLEVVQQLPPNAAHDVITLLCRHADTVLFSAPPCANDRNPKCPRPKSHWIDEFHRRNFQLDETISAHLKATWKSAGTAIWFSRDPMVFVNKRNELQT
jgi:2-polyprenyl-3-methyl-5-hydroxy-6-metoxy-1,4-benzoquinol methylase